MVSTPQRITLRAVTTADVALFFDHQRDPEASTMAAFTATDRENRAEFDAHWSRIRANAAIALQTITCDGLVAGYIVAFDRLRQREVGYWIGRRYWNRGIATAALRLLLSATPDRPLYARAASDNAASLRVLGKCGFTVCGHDTAFANAREQNIDETILILT